MAKSNNNEIKARSKWTLGDIVVHIILVILSVIWVLPIAWIIMISFRGEKGQYVSTLLPKSLTLANYTKLFTDTGILNFMQMFKNTLIIAIFSCIISTAFVLAVSYCMSRMRFRLRKPFMNVEMHHHLTDGDPGMFPGFMAMIAVYYILKVLGLSEGSLIRVALVLVYSGGSGLGFYIAKGFFDTIPKSLEEAAYLDGATRWQSFTRIIIPLSRPIIVYTVLNSFLAPWIDFVFAKVICRANKDYYTVSIGLWNMLEKEYVYNWFNSFAAGAVLISVPIIILFMIMQKCYKDSMSGGVKG